MEDQQHSITPKQPIDYQSRKNYKNLQCQHAQSDYERDKGTNILVKHLINYNEM